MLRLREAKLKLKASKCSFFKKHIQYLGHLVSGDGIEPLPEKLEAVENMPPPKTPKEVRQFLGLVYKARHAHKRLYTVLPKYSKIQVLPGITSCRLVKDNKQAIELNSLLINNMPKGGYG